VIAIGLGFDAPVPGLMKRPPRDASAPIIDRTLGIRLGLYSFVMAVLALLVVAWADNKYDLIVATTMGLTTLSLMHVVAGLEARERTGTIFSRYTFSNRRFVQMIGLALVFTFLVTSLGPLQRIFHTVALDTKQWGVCLIAPIVYVAVVEIMKWLDRRSGAVPKPHVRLDVDTAAA
jgi:P-type Ca2+ transporter type 2C